MADEQKLENTPFSNALRLAGDTLIAPGTSLLIDGKIGPGAARVAVGFAARAVLGPIGWFAVAADAYAKSTTGTGLLERVINKTKPASQAVVSSASKNPDMNDTY